MEAAGTTTIRVRDATRVRLYAQRKAPEGAEVESIDDVITRLLDELDALRGAVKGRGGGRSRVDTGVTQS